MPRVIVTGSSGFIGSRLVKTLESKKIPVIGIDIRRAPTTDVILDLSDYSCRDELKKAMKKQNTTHVIHLAGLISVEEGEKQPLKYWSVNFKGTYNVLEAMSSLKNLPKIIFSSSAAVYKSSPVALTPSSFRYPSSVYGWSKYHAEDLIINWGEGIDYCIFRLFNVVGGKEENPTHLIPKTLKRLSEGKSPVIYGTDYKTPDGTCVREYIHVKDVVKAFIDAISSWGDLYLKATICNLSTGRSCSVNQVCKDICKFWLKKTGTIAVITFSERRSGDTACVKTSVASMYNILKWLPQRGLQEMIEDTYNEMFE